MTTKTSTNVASNMTMTANVRLAVYKQMLEILFRDKDVSIKHNRQSDRIL
jgi:hypothetical protein